MAGEQGKGYPLMPIRSWWALRRKFRASIPNTVSPTYVASALGITELAARNNILPTLRKVGLIDTSGRSLPLATEWRDDSKYAQVCAAIRTQVYPQELIDLAPDASVSRDEVQAWFANHTSAGESAAAKMAAFYVMLLEATPNSDAAPAAKGSAPKSRTAKAQPGKGQRRSRDDSTTAEDGASSGSRHAGNRPSIHLNLQLHISPEASAEQIDKIFASMAKHLNDLR